MIYLTIDGCISGTGIRNAVSGGFIDPHSLSVSAGLTEQIEQWVKDYEQAHYRQFDDEQENERLDAQGLAIRSQLTKEIPDSKIDYFSESKMRKMHSEKVPR